VAVGSAGRKLVVLGRVELLELLPRAVEPDQVVLDARDQVHRHQPRKLLLAPGLDDQMGERIGHRVGDHPGQLRAPPVGRVDVGADL
jgi:hypothetical protein